MEPTNCMRCHHCKYLIPRGYACMYDRTKYLKWEDVRPPLWCPLREKGNIVADNTIEIKEGISAIAGEMSDIKAEGTIVFHGPGALEMLQNLIKHAWGQGVPLILRAREIRFEPPKAQDGQEGQGRS